MSSADVAKQDIVNINVFPNPYYGVNTEELNKYQRFVTFSHLPQHATIKIFNLAGVQVRQIEHLSASQFERWDLANESGFPVGSGLYIAHITHARARRGGQNPEAGDHPGTADTRSILTEKEERQ